MIWNTIAIILFAVRLLPFFSDFISYPDTSWNITLSGILSSYWSYDGSLNPKALVDLGYPINIPLWFIRDLMIVVLCAPMLYWMLKHTRYYFVSLLGILWFASCYYYSERINMFATAFFFFGWGAYMSINKKDMLIEFGRFFKLSIILYPLLALLSMVTMNCYPEVSETMKNLNIFVGVFFAYNIASWLLKRNFCKVSPFLASSSFFIYLSHGLICGRLLKALFLYIKPSSDISVLMVYILAVILTLSILLLSFYMLKRYTPDLLKVLAGRK